MDVGFELDTQFHSAFHLFTQNFTCMLSFFEGRFDDQFIVNL